jgi:hypothetical protein
MDRIDRNEAGAALGERAPVRNNAKGWGVAAFIVLLAIGCVVGAWWLHTETYRHPADPAAPVGTEEHREHA